jgi:hypothetical protein
LNSTYTHLHSNTDAQSLDTKAILSKLDALQKEVTITRREIRTALVHVFRTMHDLKKEKQWREVNNIMVPYSVEEEVQKMEEETLINEVEMHLAKSGSMLGRR